MKKIVYGLSILLLAACSGGGENKSATAPEKDENTTEKQQVCTYSFEPESKTEVLWVAYKYSDKTGVKGVFDDVNVTATGEGASLGEVLNGSEMTIHTGSVNSGDATRDPKIRESFFGSLNNGDQIMGKVKSLDDATNTLVVDITMNGSTQPVTGSYTFEEGKLEIKLELNVTAWGAEGAIGALNEVCSNLHKGSDGQSILWPDVTVFVSTELAKNCQ